MLASLGVRVLLCAGLGDESGEVLEHLIPDDGIELRSVPLGSRKGASVQDRRGGDRTVVAQAPGGPLDRHEHDALYELALTRRSGAWHRIAVRSARRPGRPGRALRQAPCGPAGQRRTVAVDLSGDRLGAALQGGPSLVKVSHEELVDDGRCPSPKPADLVEAMRGLRADGAGTVVVSRADEPALPLVDDDVVAIHTPPLQPAEPKRAGDSMTAGMVAVLARGGAPLDALQRGGMRCVEHRAPRTGHRRRRGRRRAVGTH